MSNELIVIDPITTSELAITWDMGRRCNYDCTYCPPFRHDNFSPHAHLEELKSTARFALDYASEMVSFKHSSTVGLSFTGGEPTVHPQFIELGMWLKNIKQKYISKRLNTIKLSLTSNGAFSQTICDHLIENYNFAVISYHCEAPKRLKNKVKRNIFYLKERGFSFSCNVMFHSTPKYFEECIELCDLLKANEIKFIPRMIGEHKDNNRYNHKYTNEQLKWIREYWFGHKEADQIKKETAVEKATEKLQLARNLGRPCCGGNSMNICDAKTKQWHHAKFLKFTEFKNWKCAVNWFFLHIEQQTGLIYHHQTCQARFDGTRGPIGAIKDADQILNNLKTNLKKQKMPVISCPNNLCGCGLCAPKAAKMEDFKKILPRHIDCSVFKSAF